MRTSKITALAAALAAALVLSAPARAGTGASAIDRDMALTIRKLVPAYVFVGGGSGVAISPDGYVLTNHHVAGKSKIWKVRLAGGDVYVADLVGTDPVGDVALLKMRKADGVAHVAMGDSDAVRVGQTAIAIGNPFGLGMTDDSPTVTRGVISATNRYQGNYSDAIQTDAPINPGNSGGPLLTLDGKLIGINGRINTRFGTRSNTGIGYAISINQIKRFLPALKAAKGGKVHHGTIRGLILRRFNPSLGGEDKAIVRSVAKGSTAEKAGLQPGDVILSVDNYPIVNYARFAGVLGTYPSGATVNVQVRRGDAKQDLAVKLDLRPIPGPVEFGWTAERLSTKSLKEDGGIKLKAVKAGGAAEKAGLKAGDVVTELSGVKLDNPMRVVAMMRRGFEPGLPVKGKAKREVEEDGKKVTKEIAFTIKPARGKRADLGFRYSYDRTAGALVVAEVKPRGPAAKAKLQVGDLVTHLGGVDLSNPRAAMLALRRVRPGQKLKLKIKRSVEEDGKQVTKELELELKVGSK